MQNSEHILTDTPPKAGLRLTYGSDPNQFGELRLPTGKGPFPAAMFLHGGFWRERYDLAYGGFLCAALTATGFVTWNVEYRRVGNPGGGWPGSFEDVTSAYRFLRQLAGKYAIDLKRVLILGHSAGGELALALAAHHNSSNASIHAAVSMAGVLNLHRAWDLHLSHDAVTEFLGGTPEQVPEHYREASPSDLDIHCLQLIVHGTKDDTVPIEMSRAYVAEKKVKREKVKLMELADAGHFELADPQSSVWPAIQEALLRASE